MIDQSASYHEIDTLLAKVQRLLRQQIDSIKYHRSIEQYLERNERGYVIKELIAHVQFLQQLRNDTSPKQPAGGTHPTGVEERDRILAEVSTLLQEQVQHIEDLANPYARPKYQERAHRIQELLKVLQTGQAVSSNGEQGKRA